MKSRLFVVDSSSIVNTINSNIASIIVPDLSGRQWLKTVADIMADMLQIEIGDYIFLWERKSGSQKNRIHGVYRAVSKPFYLCSSPDDRAPFKIHIEKAYDFRCPVDEYDVLNNPHIKDKLWTIIGKKVAGKSRGTTPLSLDEANYLITLLIGKNPSYTFTEFDPARTIQVVNPLQVSYALSGETQRPTINTLNPNAIAYFDASYNVKYEKVLETLFNQELTNRNASFFNPLGIDVNKVIWYSNYLPYSLEQSEMDYVVMESDDNIAVTHIYLIEFIKGEIDEAHIQRACLYSKWINETQGLGCNVSNPIIVCRDSVDFINGEHTTQRVRKLKSLEQIINMSEQEYNANPLKVFTYDISANGIVFSKRK